MTTPLDQIESTRARLRAALMPAPPPALPPPSRHGSWYERARGFPTVRLILDSLGHWWQHHPLRSAVFVASEASSAVARPLASRHPIGLVVGAAVVGAALARTRPWRWLLRPALFAGLVPQLASRVVTALPLEAWMTAVGAALSRPATGEAPAKP